MPNVNHIYNDSGRRLIIDKLLTGDQSQTWKRSPSMELGRLAHGNKYGVDFTDTIEFMSIDEVPKPEKVAYAQCVCDHRPLKPEKYRVRIVVGGDKLDFEVDAVSPSINLVEFKLLLNSVISEAKQGVNL